MVQTKNVQTFLVRLRYSNMTSVSTPNNWDRHEQLMSNPSQWLKTTRTVPVWIISMIESDANTPCLRQLNEGELLEQPMFGTSQRGKATQTTRVWDSSTRESYANNPCLRQLNEGKLCEHPVFETAQRGRATRTTHVWDSSTRESYANNPCLRQLNEGELCEQSMFETAQRGKAMRTAVVRALPMLWKNKRCHSFEKIQRAKTLPHFENYSLLRKNIRSAPTWCNEHFYS